MLIITSAHVLCLCHFLAVSFSLQFDNSELYRNAICVSEDVVGEETDMVRKSSFNSKLRKGSTCNVIDDSLVIDCPGTPCSSS